MKTIKVTTVKKGRGNGVAIATRTDFAKPVLDFCKDSNITVEKQTTFGHDVCGDPMKYEFILSVQNKKLGIVVQSQTEPGTTDKKIFHTALSMKDNKTFPTVLVPIGPAWREKVIAGASRFCTVIPEKDVITYLKGVFVSETFR